MRSFLQRSLDEAPLDPAAAEKARLSSNQVSGAGPAHLSPAVRRRRKRRVAARGQRAEHALSQEQLEPRIALAVNVTGYEDAVDFFVPPRVEFDDSGSGYRRAPNSPQHFVHGRVLIASDDADDVFIRGEYWVGDRVQEFFREWLDYKAANTSFKDHPGSTSQWHVPDTKPDRYEDTNRGYTNLQNGFYGHESTLVEQLDDTVARAVVESHANGKANGTNVFHELMTTRMWRLPSNVVNTNETKCTDNSACETCMPLEPNMPNASRYCLDSTGVTTRECNTDSQCYSRCTTLGLCGSSISSNTTTTLRPYNLTGNIEHTSEARWHEMPHNERRGVLTHPAWLGAHGGNFQDDASAVGRGRWIRENLFCESVPGLELVMVEAKLIASDSTRSARDRLVTSVENEVTCMGCHSKMNSLGYPFEIYNHAGFVRTWDHIAEPPDNQGEPDGRTTIDNLPDAVMNTDFTSALDFIDAIADSPYARRCFIRQAFRFFMGRDEVLSDACTLTAMEAALNSDGSFFSMLEVLVGSESFQYRSDASEGGTR